MKQLFKITWKIPFVEYETLIAAANEEEALAVFQQDVLQVDSMEKFRKDVLQDDALSITSIEVVDFNGVLVTKKI